MALELGGFAFGVTDVRVKGCLLQPEEKEQKV